MVAAAGRAIAMGFSQCAGGDFCWVRTYIYPLAETILVMPYNAMVAVSVPD